MGVVKACGEIMRMALNNITFNLDDKFCDGDEMKESWENTQMPDQLFFSPLFNIHRSCLLKFKMINILEDDDALKAENYDAREDVSLNFLHKFPRVLSNQQNQLEMLNLTLMFCYRTHDVGI